MSGQQRELAMRFLAEPSDINFGGKVHGGVVMKWIDQAGYAAALGWSGRYSVTVPADAMNKHGDQAPAILLMKVQQSRSADRRAIYKLARKIVQENEAVGQRD